MSQNAVETHRPSQRCARRGLGFNVLQGSLISHTVSTPPHIHSASAQSSTNCST